MELLSQEQKDSAVEKIRKSNIEKRAREKEKAPKVSLTKNLLEKKNPTIERKVQKDIFRSHRELLEKIWVIGRGLIFAKHLCKIANLKRTEMYSELRFLQKAGLVNIIKIFHQNLIQLTQFSVNQFQKKTRIVPVINSMIIKHALLGEILQKKLEQALIKDINTTSEVFLEKISEQTNFCRTEKTKNVDVWAKLDKLRKRDSYCQLSEAKIFVYILDIYHAEARRMVQRIFEIYNYLDDNDLLDKFSVQFIICVVDERRKKYLSKKHRVFTTYLQAKHLSHFLVNRIKINSYDLTERVFAKNKLIP